MVRWLLLLVPVCLLFWIFGPEVPQGAAPTRNARAAPGPSAIKDYTIKDADGTVVYWIGENLETGELEFTNGDEASPRFFMRFDGDDAQCDYIPYGVARRRRHPEYTITRRDWVHVQDGAGSIDVYDTNYGGWRLVSHHPSAGERPIGDIVPVEFGWEFRDARTKAVTNIESDGDVIEIERDGKILFTCEGFGDPGAVTFLAMTGVAKGLRRGLVGYYLRIGR